MKSIAAIIAILLLEGWAIYNQINGVLLGVAIAAIAGIGGYSIKEIPFIKK